MPKSLKKLSSKNESFVRVSFGIYLEAVPTLSLRCPRDCSDYYPGLYKQRSGMSWWIPFNIPTYLITRISSRQFRLLANDC
jgi:hypothetical protein